MAQFNGFASDNPKFISIPEQVFTELLGIVDDVSELKLVLYILYRLDQMEGNFRYLLRQDFASDQRFLRGLGGDVRKDASEGEKILDETLRKVVERGILLEACANRQGEKITLYFLNTPRGKAAVEAIRKGSFRPTGDIRKPLELVPERPNIYRLYEQNIGPLTPMIADMLRDAEENYPEAWLEDALRIALSNNVRRWRYVEAILRHWKEEGRDERKDRQDTQEDFRRYTKGKFAEFLNP